MQRHPSGSIIHTLLQAVYEEDLIHRQPGVANTLDTSLEKFPVTRSWVKQEVSTQTDKEGEIGVLSEGFTRIVIGEIKSEILQELASAAGRDQLCRYTYATPLFYFSSITHFVYLFKGVADLYSYCVWCK